MKAFIAIFFTCLAFSLPVTADIINGKVVGIVDGDTIDVLANGRQHRIRLAGIDAPEKSQAFGSRSKENLSTMVFGKSVSVQWTKTDRDERAVGKVLMAGQDTNLAQVQAGLAWHFKKYQKEQSPADRTSYAQAENEARARRIGLWVDANPISPSDYRHGTGDASPEKRIQAGEACPCGAIVSCAGPKGGTYCVTNGGKKKYL